MVVVVVVGGASACEEGKWIPGGKCTWCCIGSAGICIGFVCVGKSGENDFFLGGRVCLGVGGGIVAKYLATSALGPRPSPKLLLEGASFRAILTTFCGKMGSYGGGGGI